MNPRSGNICNSILVLASDQIITVDSTDSKDVYVDIFIR